MNVKLQSNNILNLFICYKIDSFLLFKKIKPVWVLQPPPAFNGDGLDG